MGDASIFFASIMVAMRSTELISICLSQDSSFLYSIKNSAWRVSGASANRVLPISVKVRHTERLSSSALTRCKSPFFSILMTKLVTVPCESKISRATLDGVALSSLSIAVITSSWDVVNPDSFNNFLECRSIARVIFRKAISRLS